MVPSAVLADSLLRIAEDIVCRGFAKSRYGAAADLLLRNSPRLRGIAFEQRRGEAAVEFAKRIVPALRHSILSIQGPPGAGKTHTGAQMICDLVRSGPRVPHLPKSTERGFAYAKSAATALRRSTNSVPVSVTICDL